MSTVLISFLLVALGGGIGSSFRYGCSLLTQHYIPTMPWCDTLGVNIVGSFLIGFLVVLGMENYPTSSFFSPLFIVGFCGGFTTFSSFSLDAYRLYEAGDTWLAVLYILLSLVLAGLALIAGFYVGGKIAVR